MFALIWFVAIVIGVLITTRYTVVISPWLPSNIVLNAIRTRRGLKWGMPAMLLAIPYFAIAYWCTVAIDNGGPGWLHLVVLIGIWSGFKFVWIGPISLVRLAMVRISEHTQRRRGVSSVSENGRTLPDAPTAESVCTGS